MDSGNLNCALVGTAEKIVANTYLSELQQQVLLQTHLPRLNKGQAFAATDHPVYRLEPLVKSMHRHCYKGKLIRK